ncbi:hypothetical protein SDC9_176821 [bioreactor metagenome]|uniref:Uncharacterized protein n=1 Tax=bioreactor metagenome TaxID=1076179 RepID=A0A645GR44_9ZZZZ
MADIPQIPMAIFRSAGGKTWYTMDIVTGMIIPPPTA